MIRNYLKTLLLSMKRQKGFMALNLFTLTGSMLVILLLVAVFSIMVEPDILKETDGTLYNIQVDYGQYSINNIEENKFTIIKSIFQKADLFLISQTHSHSMVSANKNKDTRYYYINENFSNSIKLSFIEGQNFQKKQFITKQKVVVISAHLAQVLFGDKSAIDQDFVIRQDRYKIIGVFKNRIKGQSYSADFYLPLSAHPRPEIAGLTIFIKTNNGEGRSYIESQLKKHAPETKFKISTLRELKKESIGKMLYLAFILLGFSLLLPTLLLSNLTIHRMETRLEELGIRKAFGAGKKVIYRQLLIENILFTLIAGGFALLIGQYLVSSLFYGFTGSFLRFELPMNVSVSVLLIFLLFAIITGILPARKVARQTIVQSLNSK